MHICVCAYLPKAQNLQTWPKCARRKAKAKDKCKKPKAKCQMPNERNGGRQQKMSKCTKRQTANGQEPMAKALSPKVNRR